MPDNEIMGKINMGLVDNQMLPPEDELKSVFKINTKSKEAYKQFYGAENVNNSSTEEIHKDIRRIALKQSKVNKLSVDKNMQNEFNNRDYTLNDFLHLISKKQRAFIIRNDLADISIKIGKLSGYKARVEISDDTTKPTSIEFKSIKEFSNLNIFTHEVSHVTQYRAKDSISKSNYDKYIKGLYAEGSLERIKGEKDACTEELSIHAITFPWEWINDIYKYTYNLLDYFKNNCADYNFSDKQIKRVAINVKNNWKKQYAHFGELNDKILALPKDKLRMFYNNYKNLINKTSFEVDRKELAEKAYKYAYNKARPFAAVTIKLPTNFAEHLMYPEVNNA